MKRLSQQGFTFLELIISLTIVALIVLAVNAALTIGLQAADKGQGRGSENQRARAALSLINRQLKSAYPLALQTEKGIAVYFAGRRDELNFVATTARPEVGGLEKVTYFIRQQRGQRSLWLRTSAPTLPADILNDREGGLWQETEILPDIDGITWEYLRQLPTQNRQEWVDRWDGKEERQLPLAVRLSWRARLGELPFEWHVEVPLTVRFPQTEMLAPAQAGGRSGRRGRRGAPGGDGR
ncbi:MAG: prepilin-type N-terminal cleavage/methylation domain-containing protein [Deltaproteobacteria bacterium]|nr:prepilin-type N-terminal cleavage/methylation domain-containing protein [Deltaproteobacteria bacterium]